ncbi:MAG: hypothetical protein Q4G46_02155 [Propionibacteriaceae bacterium]|nr:hypothetical protein [Propionibacteriaceae bacterium]
MKKITLLLVLGSVLLSGCSNQASPPSGVAPTPSVIAAPATPKEPTQEELSAEAERVYRTFFDEVTRLEREGGALEPTQILLDNGTGKYLDANMAILREQVASGETVGGPLPTVTVKPAPGGNFSGVDPRLTLYVCEDSSQGWFQDSEGTYQGGIGDGNIYLGRVDGRMKIMASDMKLVDECAP